MVIFIVFEDEVMDYCYRIDVLKLVHLLLASWTECKDFTDLSSSRLP
jgi:hypothetical protein